MLVADGQVGAIAGKPVIGPGNGAYLGVFFKSIDIGFKGMGSQ